jgi:squalene-hopene/tetraprenyl-beta-curcumene cyclase
MPQLSCGEPGVGSAVCKAKPMIRPFAMPLVTLSALSAALLISTPDLLTPGRRRELERMIWSHQQTDGGWSIRTFLAPGTLGGRERAERPAPESDERNPSSDGYQTGLAVVVLRDAGVPADDPRLKRAVRWLLANQRQSGRWWTHSLNRESRFHFISYSGTAYAAWALAKCDALATDVQRRE